MKQISKILLALIIFISAIIVLCSCESILGGITGDEPTTECTHVYGDWSVVSGEFCEERLHSRTCTICGNVDYREGTEADHYWGEVITVEPTCNKEGYDERTCRLCEKVETLATYPIVDHYWGEVTTVEPTCINEGYDERTCRICEKVEKTNTVPATGEHDFIITGTYEPNCVSGGIRNLKCIVCDLLMAETFGEPTGEHDYTRLVAFDEYHTYYCWYCNEENGREEHIYVGDSPICEICGYDSRPAYEISIWVSEIDGVASLFAKQIDRFAALYGYRINYSIEGITEADAGYLIVADPTYTPDLFCFTQEYTTRLYNAGALATPSLNATNSILTANDAASILAASVNGKVQAYPMTSDNGYYMYYDSSVITNPDSLEQIIADCEAAGKKIRFAADNAWYMASFFFATGCESEWIMDENGQFIGEFIGVNDSFNSPEGLIAMKGLQKLTQSSAYESNADVCSDDTAVWITGIWYHNYAIDFGFEATDLPSFTIDGVTYHMGSYSGNKLIGVKPQEDEEKAKLLEELALYLTGYECQIERFNEFGFGTSNLQAQGEIEDIHFGIAALHKQAEFAVPQGNIYGDWWDIAGALGIKAQTAKTEQDLKDALYEYNREIQCLFIEPTEWSLIGTINGTVWDTDFPLTKVADSIYESDPLHMKAGDEFLIRKDQNWEMYFGYHGIYGGNFKIENDGEYVIRITVISEYEINVEILPAE